MRFKYHPPRLRSLSPAPPLHARLRSAVLSHEQQLVQLLAPRPGSGFRAERDVWRSTYWLHLCRHSLRLDLLPYVLANRLRRPLLTQNAAETYIYYSRFPSDATLSKWTVSATIHRRGCSGAHDPVVDRSTLVRTGVLAFVPRCSNLLSKGLWIRLPLLCVRRSRLPRPMTSLTYPSLAHAVLLSHH